jgi:hypothetical protein
VFLGLGGNIARVLTTLAETPDDLILMASHGTTALLQGTIFVQVLMTGCNTKKPKQKVE